MAKEQNKPSKKLKITIAVLLTLLILSAGALIVRIAYLHLTADKSTTIILPDNIIGEATDSTSTESTEQTNNSNGGTGSGNQTKATVVELYKGQPSDNEKFRVTNMLHGDTETKYFAVKVSHNADVAVYFNAEITEQTKNLANVLHIKVTHLEDNQVIYSGAFADMNIDGYGKTLATIESTETIAYYKIEVSLPTSAGNEYQAAKLLADFNWNVLDTGPLDSPQTGDTSNMKLYFIMMCCSLVMIIILLFFRLREKEDEYAEAN